jgi:hypothetical protein
MYIGNKVWVYTGHGNSKAGTVRDIRIMPKGGKAYQIELAGGVRQWFAENEVRSEKAISSLKMRVTSD